MKHGRNRAYQPKPDKQGAERPELHPGEPELDPRVKCGRCGRIFKFIKQRKNREHRYTTCPGCGTAYKKTQEQLDQLYAKSRDLGRPTCISN